MELLHKFIDKLNGRRLKIAVVGDSMLDEYYNIEANRVSPEFPIPVMLSASAVPDYTYPGGAANVAFLLSKFNVDPYLVSFLDIESMGSLTDCGINTSCCMVDIDGDNLIPRKKRLYNGDFPLCRWDIEKPQMGFSNKDLFDLQLKLLRQVEALNPDVVILSDYGKGMFVNVSGQSSLSGNLSKEMWIWNDSIKEDRNHFIVTDCEASAKRSWTTIVDPKNDNLFEWNGCTVFKPNNHEAKKLTGEDDHVLQVEAMKGILSCDFAVVTHGGEKIVGFDEEAWTIDGRHKGEARFPIGAGDCFISTLAMAYPFFTPKEAAEIAYEMGAIYVNTEDRRIGPESLSQSKIRSPEELAGISGVVGFANGCFDCGLTRGHIEIFKFAKSNCDKLIVALNDDNSVNRLKGDPRPIVSLRERMEVVAALEDVDYVTSFSEDTPLNVIKKIRPDRIFKGGDYEAKDVVGNELAEVLICPLYDCLSTTEKLSLQE